MSPPGNLNSLSSIVGGFCLFCLVLFSLVGFCVALKIEKVKYNIDLCLLEKCGRMEYAMKSVRIGSTLMWENRRLCLTPCHQINLVQA